MQLTLVLREKRGIIGTRGRGNVYSHRLSQEVNLWLGVHPPPAQTSEPGWGVTGLGVIMADFDTSDVIRLGCVTQLDGLYEVVNVFHVQITGGGNLPFATASADLQEYCDALYAYIEASQSDFQTDKHISIKNMTQAEVWGNIAFSAYAGGTNVNSMTAPQVACLAFGRTVLSRVQIRKYLGVFTVANFPEGVWDGVVRGACDNLMTYHIAIQTMTNGMQLKGCAYRESDARVTFATGAVTSAQPVIQRRRRRGRGS